MAKVECHYISDEASAGGDRINTKWKLGTTMATVGTTNRRAEMEKHQG